VSSYLSRGTVSALGLQAVLALIGCTANDGGIVRKGPPPPFATDTVQIVHVVSERELIAGFPIGPGQFVTAAAPLEPLPIAVVEGYPMLVVRTPQDGKKNRGGATRPWAVVAGRGLNVLPNRIESDEELLPSDTLLLGGYVLPNKHVTAVTYLDVPATIVRGHVLGPVREVDGQYELVEVAVPPGDYSAFVGGPAARRDDDGSVRVWGVIVRASAFTEVGPPGDEVLAVVRLPAELSHQP